MPLDFLSHFPKYISDVRCVSGGSVRYRETKKNYSDNNK